MKASAKELFSLEGKVALVTGGYGGIGQAITDGLAASGAKVAISGHNLEKAKASAASLNSRGFEAYGCGFDVLSVDEIQQMVNEVVNHFGRLDILVNTVGLNREEKATEVTEQTFDYVMDVNLKGAMFQAQAAARQMVKQETGGKQVHLGSVRTQLALRGRGYAAYCSSKGGLGILCKQLAAEWAPKKINVNVVAPTFVETEQVAKMLSDRSFYESIVNRIPLGRIGTPRDVMGAVLFLVSPASDFITGQTLYVDGGITATQ
jgi:NAD(P)-dependent dehydrogenase (short-subunit alcohol dehydrogenase family)